MLRGLYSAATTMDAADLQHAIVSRNLAHSTVPGFRRSFVHQSSTGDDQGGSSGYSGAGAAEVAIDFQHGSEDRTGRQLDCSLMGDGFFIVQGPGGPLYTRNGSFHIDAQGGQLVTQEGLPVLGDKGSPIEIPTNAAESDITISATGKVAVRGKEVGILGRANFKNMQALVSQGASLFEASPAAELEEVNTMIQTGARERSNVNPASELVTMLLGMRQYQAAQRTMDTIGSAMKQRMEIGAGG